MYCPKCSQPQVSDELQFCSRCGLALSNLKEMILADGKTKVSQAKTSEDKLSPRHRGIRQGAMLMLLSLILIPAYILLAALFPAQDRLIESSVSDTPFEKISQAILFTIFMAGLARVLYARFFQQDVSLGEGEPEVTRLDNSSSKYALPPAQSIPVSGFGAWRANTGEMVQSPSVTEHTTKSLDVE
jgi:hypothetical protein